MKEYIIRIDNSNKKLEKACKKLTTEFEGEFYTKTINDKYKLGHLKLTPRQRYDGISKDKIIR